MNGQQVTTQPLPPDGCFALIYMTPGQQPITCVMKDPPDEVIEAAIQQHANVAGPHGAPLLKAAKKKRFARIAHFPAMRLAVFASSECLEEFKAAEERLAAAAQLDAARAAEGIAAGEQPVELAPTLAAIKRLPTSPVVRRDDAQ